MKSFTILVCLIVTSAGLLLFLQTTPVAVSDSGAPAAKELHYQVQEKTDSVLETESYLVLDIMTGDILFAHQEDTVRPIASITKLFTAATTLAHGNLSTPTTINAADVATEGRFGKLQAGEEYKVRDLLWPLLLESSNDAAVALARSSDIDLVDLINRDVTQALPGTTLHLDDTSGLSPDNVASAADLAVAVSYLYHQEPHLFDITKLSSYIGPYVGWRNNSPLLGTSGYLGGKHGYTEAALRTVAAVYTEDISGEKRELLYVVLGTTDIAKTVASLRALVKERVTLRSSAILGTYD